MGGTAPRKQLATSSKTRSGASSQKHKQTDTTTAIKQAAKKKHKKWSKERAERVREALDRDPNLMHNALGKPTNAAPSLASRAQTENVLMLTKNMQTLGK